MLLAAGCWLLVLLLAMAMAMAMMVITTYYYLLLIDVSLKILDNSRMSCKFMIFKNSRTFMIFMNIH